MSGPVFRFLHASDFRLHEVCSGLAHIPESLREVLVDAPYKAVQRVFDAALAEQVQFVLLSGDLLNPLDASGRSLAFLVQQFERLAERQVPVFWAGGRLDPPERWPDGAPLPGNVTYFSRTRLEEAVHYIDDRPAVTIVGRSYGGKSRIDPADFARESSEEFRIAVGYGETEAEHLAGSPVHFWALGGRGTRRTLIEQPRRVVHYPGSPQGRSPREPDVHGCTLVHVDAQRQIQARQLATDVVRWATERVVAPAVSGRADLVRLLRERSRALRSEIGDRTLLVSWELEVDSRTAAELTQGTLADEIVRELATHAVERGIWTVGLQPVVQQDLPAAWYEEDTILGDFLRAVGVFRGDAQPLRLQEIVGQRELDVAVQDLAQISDPTERDELLREAAWLGAELLRGES